MELNFTVLQVSDMEASLRFYRDQLGIQVQRTGSAGGRSLAFLGPKGNLELICDGTALQTPAGAGMILGFEVETGLDALVESLKAEGVAVEGPVMPVPTRRFFVAGDPDGYQVQLVEVLE